MASARCGGFALFHGQSSFMPEKDAFLSRETQAARPEGYGLVKYVNL